MNLDTRKYIKQIERMVRENNAKKAYDLHRYIMTFTIGDTGLLNQLLEVLIDAQMGNTEPLYRMMAGWLEGTK